MRAGLVREVDPLLGDLAATDPELLLNAADEALHLCGDVVAVHSGSVVSRVRHQCACKPREYVEIDSRCKASIQWLLNKGTLLPSKRHRKGINGDGADRGLEAAVASRWAYLLLAPSSLSSNIPIPPDPRIMPLLLALKGLDAEDASGRMHAAPRMRNPLPSQGMRLSDDALSPAITTTLSARPT